MVTVLERILPLYRMWWKCVNFSDLRADTEEGKGGGRDGEDPEGPEAVVHTGHRDAGAALEDPAPPVPRSVRRNRRFNPSVRGRRNNFV